VEGEQEGVIWKREDVQESTHISNHERGSESILAREEKGQRHILRGEGGKNKEERNTKDAVRRVAEKLKEALCAAISGGIAEGSETSCYCVVEATGKRSSIKGIEGYSRKTYSPRGREGLKSKFCGGLAITCPEREQTSQHGVYKGTG